MAQMAESTPILAQFMSFPKSESNEKISDEIDSSSAHIDSSNSNSLSKTLSSLEAGINNASVKWPLRRQKPN